MVSGKVLAENKWQEVLNLLGNIQEYLSEEEFNQSEFARKVYQANAKMMLGKWEDVMMLLKKGNASGFSFPLHWKLFAELENDPEFANIKQANEEVIQKAKKNTKYEYEVMLPEGYDGKQKYPLFFCLHGDGFCCNKKEQMHYWKTDAIRNKGAIVAGFSGGATAVVDLAVYNVFQLKV